MGKSKLGFVALAACAMAFAISGCVVVPVDHPHPYYRRVYAEQGPPPPPPPHCWWQDGARYCN